MMSETKNAKRRKRYVEDEEFRERDKARSRAWKEANRDYIHERERKGRERMREALGRPERYCMPWTKDEDERLRSMVGMRSAEIAEALHRSEAGVRRRAINCGMGWDGTRRLAEHPAGLPWCQRLTDDAETARIRKKAERRAFYV